MQRGCGHLRQHFAVGAAAYPQHPVVGHAADGRGRYLPSLADGCHFVHVGGRDNGQHPLLRLRGHDLERRHVGLPLRHRGHVHRHAGTATRRGLAGGAGEPGAAKILDTADQARFEHLQARLDEALLFERVAHLHVRPLVGVVGTLVEARRRQHADASDAVASGARAHQHGHAAHFGGLAEHQSLRRHDPECGHIHERVVAIGLARHELSCHGGHADAVPVAGDPADDSLGNPVAAGLVQRPHAQRIGQCNGPGAHGEDVAQDAADAGCRTLIGLNGRRMIVALDAHGHCDAVAHVHDACVLARAHQHPRRIGGQACKMPTRRLIGAVLRPHHCVHRKLEVIRPTFQQLADVLVLGIGEAERYMDAIGIGGELARRHVRRPVSRQCSHFDLPSRSECAVFGCARDRQTP